MRIDYPSKPLLLWAFAFIASQIFKRSPDDDPSIFPEAYDVTYEEIAEQCSRIKFNTTGPHTVTLNTSALSGMYYVCFTTCIDSDAQLSTYLQSIKCS